MSLFNSKIRKLDSRDTEDAINLYARTCRYTEYFQKLFNVQDCEQKIKEEFSEDVIAAINLGFCYGIFENNEMIGCLFAIDWYKYLEQEPDLFERMFNAELQSTQNIINLASQSSSCIFIFAIGIADGKRCQGYATKLIKYFMKQVSKDAVVLTDCIYEYAMSLWLGRGFSIVEIGEDKFAISGDLNV